MGCGASSGATKVSTPATIQKMDQELLLYVKEGGKEKMRMSVWDFGGQDTFYGLHHLYMSRSCVYVIMFNMEWCLPGHKCSKCDGGSKHLDFLAFWLDSIALHGVDREQEPPVAPILLVGTHKDRVKSPAEHENISKLLYDTFKHKPAWSSVELFEKATGSSGRGNQWFFPVDNTIGNKDPVLLEIKQVVQERVQKEKYVNEKVPFVWLDVLEKLQSGDKGSSITLEKVKEICKDCGLSDTAKEPLDAQVMAMLKRFNDLGQLMYHPDVKLRELVILDPASYLVAPASRIICDHEIHTNDYLKKARNYRSGQLYSRLREKGILHAELLDILWEDRREHIEALQMLLVKYGFFVPILQDIKGTTPEKERRYLIPHLLPKSLSPQNLAPKLVSYLFFAFEDTMKEIRKKGYVDIEDARRKGFFPMGLGPAVIGQLVSECQRVDGMTIDDMQLSMEEIVTSFGKHEFAVRSNMELNAMELLIMVDSSLCVAERMLELVGNAVEKMVPNLDFVLAVDQDGGRCLNGEVATPKGPLVIISGRRWPMGKDGEPPVEGGLWEKMEKKKPEISVAPCQKLSAIEVQQHFSPWLRPRGLREGGYDIFFSYRWTEGSRGIDSELVDSVYNKVTCHRSVGTKCRQVHAFLDRQRLEVGRNFQKDFAEAAMHSTVMVLIVSKAALTKMCELTADSPEDNLLLEWSLALELLESSHLPFCLPVMIGEASEDTASISNLFAEGILDQLPEITCKSVTEKVAKLMRNNDLEPSPKLHTRTVRGTVNELLKQLGVATWDIQSSQGGVDGRSSSRSIDEWKRSIYSEIVSKAMECVENAEAKGKSKVKPDFSPVADAGAEGKSNVRHESQETALAGTAVSSGGSVVTEWSEQDVSADPAVSSIDEWLQAISLHAYAPQIKNYGCDSLQFLDNASEEDMREMTEDADVDMKKFHRSMFLKAWRRRAATRGGALRAPAAAAVTNPLASDTSAVVHSEAANTQPNEVTDTVPANARASHAAEVAEATAVPSGGSVVTEWSEQDVAKYVSGLEEFGARAIEYATAMSAEHIDGKSFVLLTADELKELGFSMGHRKNLLAHIEQLSAPAAAVTSLQPNEVPDTVPASAIASHAQQQEKEFEDAQEIGEVDGAHQLVWESMDAERVEECKRAAMEAGGKALNTSRLNIVGEGRAGKTAWLRAVSNQDYEQTDSTIGVQQTLLEVNKTDMKVDCDGRSWAIVEDGSRAIMKVKEAQKRAAAEIALQEPPEKRREREGRRRHKAETEAKKKEEEEASKHKAAAEAQAKAEKIAAAQELKRQKAAAAKAKAENFRFLGRRGGKVFDEFDELLATLTKAAAELEWPLQVTVDGPTARAVCSPGGKFEQLRVLIHGLAKESTLGLAGYMCVTEQELARRLAQGEQAIIDEVNDRSKLDQMKQQLEDRRMELELLRKDGNSTLLGVQEEELQRLSAKANAMEEEMEETRECLAYVMDEQAGSSDKKFQNGWKRDCDKDTGEVRADRQVEDGCKWEELGSERPASGTEISNSSLAMALKGKKTEFSREEFKVFKVFYLTRGSYIQAGDKYFKPAGGKRGMTIDDFVHHPSAVACKLTREQVIAARLYTTKAFLSINKPLRDLERKENHEPVPLPVTTFHLNEAIKKLRTLHALSAQKNERVVLWRAMSNAALEDSFMEEGGVELAPMSTTLDLGIALKYSASGNTAVLLRIISQNFMTRGAELSWLSTFAHEEELLYSPTTYLRPLTKTPAVFKIGSTTFKVVDVEAQMP